MNRRQALKGLLTAGTASAGMAVLGRAAASSASSPDPTVEKVTSEDFRDGHQNYLRDLISHLETESEVRVE